MEKMSLPLNGKQSTAYFEYYAREVLVTLMPEEFEHLKKADKPDLQDEIKYIGIEVVLVPLKNELHAVKLHDEIIDAKDETEKKKIKGQLQKMNIILPEYNGEISGINFPVFTVSSEPLIAAAKTKIAKLNNKVNDTEYEYRNFQHFRLYINASCLSPKAHYLNQLIDAVIDVQKNCERKYEAIYVFSDCFGLWICDLATKQIREYPITFEQFEHFKQRALELAGESK